MAMHCEDVQQWISDCLDKGERLDAELRRHVDHCATCAAFERDCHELDALLTAGRMDAPPAPLRRQWVRSVPLLSALAAAVIVLALLPFWRLGHRSRPNPPSPGPQPLPQVVINVPDLGQVAETIALAPVRQEFASLRADARSITSSLLSCLPSPPTGRAIQTAPAGPEAAGGEAIQ
jgi:hypothetical protein